MKVEYGQIWWAELSPTVANEQGGIRPVVVVSGPNFNAMAIAHALVVAVTTKDRGLSRHVPLTPDAGLTRPGWAMAETLRAVSTLRFDQRIGWASPESMRVLADWTEFFTMPRQG